MDFRCSVSDMSKSSPWSQCQSRSPHTEPHSSPACSQSSASSCSMVRMPFSFSRFSVRAPMPGRSRRVSWLQRLGQNVERERHQAVGLFHVAGDFGEVAIGGQADGTAQHGADPLADARLDLAAQLHGGQQRPFAAHEAAGHFVDGENGGDGQAAFDGFDDAVMVFGVDLVAALDEARSPGHIRLASATMVPVRTPKALAS